jgi:hypothetical protein
VALETADPSHSRKPESAVVPAVGRTMPAGMKEDWMENASRSAVMDPGAMLAESIAL